MPEKELDQLYLLDLGPHAYGHIRFWHLRNGKTIIDYVIQIEVTADGRTYTVRRYDCAHGKPHCDIYDHRGNQRKIWFPDTPKKDAWDAAVDEVLLHGSEWDDSFSSSSARIGKWRLRPSRTILIKLNCGMKRPLHSLESW